PPEPLAPYFGRGSYRMPVDVCGFGTRDPSYFRYGGGRPWTHRDPSVSAITRRRPLILRPFFRAGGAPPYLAPSSGVSGFRGRSRPALPTPPIPTGGPASKGAGTCRPGFRHRWPTATSRSGP